MGHSLTPVTLVSPKLNSSRIMGCEYTAQDSTLHPGAHISGDGVSSSGVKEMHAMPFKIQDTE